MLLRENLLNHFASADLRDALPIAKECFSCELTFDQNIGCTIAVSRFAPIKKLPVNSFG
ncbi:MAG: hypothetical protein F6K21_28360 [Symploca sp. SIO2D2]|nr:hypothetical protein [Symploca sp. SIO2D2]